MATPQKNQVEEQVERIEQLGDELQRRAFRLAALQARENDLTFQQYLALAHLGEREACSVNELKAALGVAQSTTSELVTRMTRAGLLTKERNAADQRAVRVTLTPRGREVLKKRRRAAKAFYSELLGARPVNEQQALFSALETVLARLPGGAPEESDEQD